jgi:hypothetical protein
MHTEHLYQTLSPQAYAALRETIKQQASRERRAAVQGLGLAWLSCRVPRALRALFRTFTSTPRKA